MQGSLYANETEFAAGLSGKAMDVLKSMQHSATVAVRKDIGDMATTADLASEELVLGAIGRQYPDDGIHSEEAGNINPGAPRRWIIDPLDGTKEYAKGLEDYYVLIALEDSGKTAMGIMRHSQGDLYAVTADGPATYNGQPIAVSRTSDLAQAFVGLHVPSYNGTDLQIDQAGELMKRLIRKAYRVRPGWSTAKQCAWVARGILDAHIICPSVNKWHDVVEGLLLVERAGGRVTDFSGRPIVAENMENGFVISNGVLHDGLLALLKETSV